MKHLIIVRHGNTDGGDTLTERGRLQVRHLAASVLGLVKQDSALIVSSPTRRAQETADIIHLEIEAEMMVSPKLDNGRADRIGYDRFVGSCIECIKEWSSPSRQSPDTLILVAHHDYAHLTAEYSDRVLGRQVDYISFGEGEAVVLEVVSGTHYLLK